MSFNINLEWFDMAAKKAARKMSKGDINYTADMIEHRRREEERKRRARMEAGLKPDDTSMDNALGLAVGLATGIPINATPGAIIGSVLHHATEERQTSTPAPAPSYDTGGSSLSGGFDTGGSVSSGGFDTGGSF